MDQQTPTTLTLALDERESAKYIGFTASYLRNARLRGRGPAYLRIGRTIRYRVQDLDAYLAKHRVHTRDSR